MVKIRKQEKKSYFQYFYSKFSNNTIIPWNKSGNSYFSYLWAGLVLSNLKVNAPEQLVHLHICPVPLFRLNEKANLCYQANLHYLGNVREKSDFQHTAHYKHKYVI